MVLQHAEQFVYALFKDKLSSLYTYHNYSHTLRVVAAAEKLCKGEKIGGEEKLAVMLAAWFHDTGYVAGPTDHEEESIRIFHSFLKTLSPDENVPGESTISLVESLIRITRMGSQPQTLAESIICDADCAHFGKKDFAKISELLREEWKLTTQRDFSELEWTAGNRDMLSQKHRFYTEYAKRKWQPQKDRNIAALQEKMLKLEKQEDVQDEKKRTKRKKAEKEKKPDRGIDTMMKVTLNNHTQLSQIADSKANILLSVNAIIISVALSTIVPKLDNTTNDHLVVPTFILLFFSVVSIIFAILSTRPKVTSGVFTRQDIQDRKVNLLFFGNFYRMPLDEYLWAMNELMESKDYLYDTMISDLYYLGLVLERKYKLLRITYNVFMVGIVVSVIAFVVAFRNSLV